MPSCRFPPGGRPLIAMAHLTRPQPRRALARAVAILAAALVLTLAVGPSVGAAGPRPSVAVRQVCGATSPGYAHCLALVRTDRNPLTASVAGVSPAAISGYHPADLQSAYGLTAASASAGAGQTVAVVDAYDDPTAESDLALYRAQFGLSACTTANGCFKKVNQTGGSTPPTANAGWSQEISLDLDMVSAICPNCSILLVEANNNALNNLGIAVNYAVSAGAKFVSNSYGGTEDGSSPTLDTLYYKHAGVVITASSGDYGYNGYQSAFGNEYPAVSPWVVAVGGTSLAPAANTRGWTESAWSDAGSGCSTSESSQAWQPVALTGCSNRMVADVSADADPGTGVSVLYQGSWYIFGGTSASAPMIAATYALAGTPAAGTWPGAYPYANGGLNDVVGGSNGPNGSCNPDPAAWCTAIAGFDGPTGLGTPNGPSAFMPVGGPGKPLSVSAVAGNGTATVSWSAPASDGGSAITGYTATSTPGGKTCAWTAGPLQCTVSALANGQPYTFTVTATNSAGTGAASDASSPVTPAGPPGQPTGVAGARGDASVSVTWIAPASNGGAAITAYTVTSSPGSKTCAWSSGPLGCTVTGLTNGQGYTFTVTAANSFGPGTASAPSATVTPSAVPGQPQAVTAVAGNASAAVSWAQPASNGGASITGYTVTSAPDGRTCAWTTGPLTCTVSLLTNGTGYTFQVTATNVAGTGAASSASATVTPRTVPSQPQGVTGLPGNGSVAVSWSAPSSTGGSTITGYTATASPGGAFCTAVGPATTCPVTGLVNGQPYTFAVTATNGAGTGLPSTASAPVTPRTLPGAPTGVAAQAGNASALVTWTAPLSDGGAAITGYTVTSSPGGKTCTWTSGPLECTVVALSNGQPYTFTVIATNVAGGGAASAPSAAATPTTVPDPPTGVTAVPNKPHYGELTVTWAAPADGGSPLTSYTATAYDGAAFLNGTFSSTGHACTVNGAPPALGCTITGLALGVPVVVRVTATTAGGTSLASVPSAQATPPTAPRAAIAALSTWTLGTSVPVSWTGTPGTNAVASYDVRYRRAAWNGTFGTSVAWQVVAPGTSSSLALLVGSTYCFSVAARDVDGFVGSWSAERCTSRPLDDRSLSRRGSWSSGTGSAYYRSTWIRSTALGASAVRASVQAKRISIVATTCPTCGSVKVYLGSTLLRTVSLVSSTTVNRHVIAVATFTSVRAGTVTVKVSSSGRRVLVDGLAISRT